MNGSDSPITTISVSRMLLLARTRRPWKVHEPTRSNSFRQIQEGCDSTSGRITFLIGRNRGRARRPQVMVKPPSTASVWPVT